MTRYKNIPYGKQYLDRADLENLQNSLSEEKITQGRLVETKLARRSESLPRC